MSEPGREARILIVDDTLQNIQVLGTILKARGYRLNAAQNGKQALKQIAKVLPDLILLDVMMPEMDGFETCRRLKADERTRDIPVIFLTAKVETDDMVEGFELGAVDYVTKPFNQGELLQRVETHLELSLLQRDLEQRVAARTAELRQAGVRLQEEHAERLRAESQLAQAQKLEAIGQLAAGVGHEINSPLQFVRSNTEFLKEVFAEFQGALGHYERLLEHARSQTLTASILEEIDEAVEAADLSYAMKQIPAALQKAEDGIERVSRIVRAMEDLSQPSTEQKLPVDLNEMVESATVVSGSEWRHVAELELDLDDSLPEVPCLPAEFGQVLVHLLVNAAHAIDAGASQGEKGRITVSTNRAGDWVEVRVSDTGTGIPEALQDRVFDPFFTTKEVGQGTGTGLSIAREVVVSKLGGEISFDTEAGRGTTFLIRLPAPPTQTET